MIGCFQAYIGVLPTTRLEVSYHIYLSNKIFHSFLSLLFATVRAFTSAFRPSISCVFPETVNLQHSLCQSPGRFCVNMLVFRNKMLHDRVLVWCTSYRSSCSFINASHDRFFFFFFLVLVSFSLAWDKTKTSDKMGGKYIIWAIYLLVRRVGVKYWTAWS